ncbi:exported protein of unknown function (plasmid) [Azospirillum baldaniorum]|uniref:L,D-TPase catalytic domain-containing protein n=1 Tax=Azospirillum baldaniorum TaxID=1064539 RepID=A0A9P1JUR9_9PROT|nr:exported protein of unknown function [Azospirillum baldaniorum]
MQRTATFLWHLVPTATLAIALALVSPGGVRAQDANATAGTTSARQIVISLTERRLHLLEEGRPPRSFPVAIGRPGVAIPLGDSQVLRKRRNPTWRPTANQRRENPALPASVPPGPSNPLGKFALDLGWTAIAIHGTNEPDSVGRRASGGCFRMLPADIAALFEMVPVGTPVRVVSGSAIVPAPQPAIAVAVPAALPTPTPPPSPLPTVAPPPLPILPDPRCATAGAPLRRDDLHGARTLPRWTGGRAGCTSVTSPPCRRSAATPRPTRCSGRSAASTTASPPAAGSAAAWRRTRRSPPRRRPACATPWPCGWRRQSAADRRPIRTGNLSRLRRTATPLRLGHPGLSQGRIVHAV